MTKPFRPDVDAPEYRGRYTPYDILKEGTIAVVAVLVLTIVLAVCFGSPDEKAITVKTWSNADPIDFATTAFSELNATSGVAQYGAPYNTNATGQQLGPLTLAKWVGPRIAINTAQDFVIAPLSAQPDQPELSTALRTWKSASTSEQTTWLNAYTKASSNMGFIGGNVIVSPANDGPVPEIINALTKMARTGALDQALVTGHSFYTTDYTKPLLFLADGTYLSSLAQHQHLLGSQWGMMNETGSYPGQAWLWLYTFWYQVPSFSSSTNADVLVFAMMGVLSLLLLFVPFIPGLRTLPRKSRVYRLIWKEHYRDLES